MARFLICCLAFFTVSCAHYPIKVRLERTCCQDFASSAIGTPDPLPACLGKGQRLIINWHLPLCYARLPLTLKVDYITSEPRQHSRTFTVYGSTGFFDFFYPIPCTPILTYRAEIFYQGRCLGSVEQKGWVSLLKLTDGPLIDWN